MEAKLQRNSRFTTWLVFPFFQCFQCRFHEQWTPAEHPDVLDLPVRRNIHNNFDGATQPRRQVLGILGRGAQAVSGSLDQTRCGKPRGTTPIGEVLLPTSFEIDLRPPRKCSTAGDGIVIFGMTCAISHCFFRNLKCASIG